MTWELCDLHTHVLPGMDDGCKTPEESVALLKLAYGQGVRYLFATPHYYPVEPVGEFLRRRDAAWSRLQGQLEKEPDACVPKICLGAEVAFRPGLSYEEDLRKLCLGKSRYLLLEMPFSTWGSGVSREIANICSAQGVVPILAHLERYLKDQSAQTLRGVLSQDVLVQMNAGYLLNFWTRGQAVKLLRGNTVQLLGSDCHNLTTRPENLESAVAILEKRGEQALLSRIVTFGAQVCRDAFDE